VLGALLVAVAGYVLIRPDWFHIQNGLDPFFYVGLSLNLADFINQGGDAHYFISRWTLYIPELLFTRVLGDSAGFLAMRLLLLAFVAWAIVNLRDRTGRWLDSMIVALAVAFSPLVLRAVFVDYSDAIVVPFGLACVVGSVQATVRLRSAALLAAAASIALIANPFAIFMVSVPLGVYLWRAKRTLLASLATMSGSAVVVGVVGLAFFRWKYGISNVYEPTIQFIANNVGYADPLKSPSLAWLGYRLWIYLPVLVLLTAWGLSALGLVRWSLRDHLVLGICAVQFVFHVLFQFIMDGSTLEIHYYFSYLIPAYSAAFAVVLYASFRACSARAVAILGGFLAAGLIGFTLLPTTRLGGWLDLLVIIAVLSVLAVWTGRRFPIIIPAALIALAFMVQTRFPVGEPRLPDEHRVDAGYDTVFAHDQSLGVTAFEQVAMFEDQMDQVGDMVEEETGFFLCGGFGPQFGASYATQVASPSHWLNPPGTEGDAGAAFAVARMAEQGYSHVAIICDDVQVEEVLAALTEGGLTIGEPVLHYRSLTAWATTVVFVAPVA
jgi:hypothetical protein